MVYGGADSQDPIEVNSISLGSAYPLLSNARIRPSDNQGRIVRGLLSLSPSMTVVLRLTRSAQRSRWTIPTP